MDRTTIINQIFDNQSVMKRGMQHYFHAQMQKMPISRSQIELLFAIKQQQPATGKQLAATLTMTAGAVSQSLDALLTQSLVVRTPDPHDRRLQLLQLSKKGEKLITNIEEHRRKVMETVITELDTDELAIWLKVQQKLITQLEQLHDKKGSI